jgi:hypothetical protein
MMQATTALSLRPLLTCLPVRFRFFTTSQSLTDSESPLTRKITRAPSTPAQRCVRADVLASGARIPAPRTSGLTYGDTWPGAAMEGNIKKDSRHIVVRKTK